MKFLLNGIHTAMVLVFLWVVFWAFIIPQVFPNLAWSGYEDMITPVLAVGFFGGAAWDLWGGS